MLTIAVIALPVGIVITIIYGLKFLAIKSVSTKCKAKFTGIKYRDEEYIYINAIFNYNGEDVDCELYIKDNKETEDDLKYKEFTIYYDEKNNEIHRVDSILLKIECGAVLVGLSLAVGLIALLI